MLRANPKPNRATVVGGPRRLVLILLVAAALASMPGRAEIVLLTDGGWLKVRNYRVTEDDRVRLDLRDGGTLILALSRIERILDDEVVAKEEPAPVPPPEPVFRVGYQSEQPMPDVPFGDLIHATAQKHDLNPALVAAVVRAESAFDAQAVSHKGARGLMQLMPATASRFGVEGNAVFDPARNVDAGSRYLRWLADRFDGDLPRILAGYNAGEGTVDRYGGVPPYRETRGYIERVYRTLGLEQP